MTGQRDQYFDAANLRFGLVTLEHWFEKADRELERVASADDDTRPDHLLNAAMTIAHLEDWFFHWAQPKAPLPFPSESVFKQRARQSNSAHRQLVDISNGAKHSFVTRRIEPNSRARTGPGVLIRDFLLNKDVGEPYPAPKGARNVRVRTIVSDDEIERLETWYWGEFVEGGPHGPRLFVDVAEEAVNFWKRTHAAAESGEWPGWIFGRNNEPA